MFYVTLVERNCITASTLRDQREAAPATRFLYIHQLLYITYSKLHEKMGISDNTHFEEGFTFNKCLQVFS